MKFAMSQSCLQTSFVVIKESDLAGSKTYQIKNMSKTYQIVIDKPINLRQNNVRNRFWNLVALNQL